MMVVISIDEKHIISGICLWPFFCCPHRPQGCCWELSQSQAPSPSSLPASHSHTVQPHLPSHVSHEQFCTHEMRRDNAAAVNASILQEWNQAWVSFRIGPRPDAAVCGGSFSRARNGTVSFWLLPSSLHWKWCGVEESSVQSCRLKFCSQ